MTIQNNKERKHSILQSIPSLFRGGKKKNQLSNSRSERVFTDAPDVDGALLRGHYYLNSNHTVLQGEVQWCVSNFQIQLQYRSITGKNQVKTIYLADVLDLHLHTQFEPVAPVLRESKSPVQSPANMMRKPQSDTSSNVSSSMTFREYTQQYNQGDITRKKLLCVVYKDYELQTCSILIIPLDSAQAHDKKRLPNGAMIEREFLKLKSNWLEMQVGARDYSDSKYKILFQNRVEHAESLTVSQWLITKDHVVLCGNEFDFPTVVPFQNVFDIEYHSSSTSKAGNCVSFHYAEYNDAVKDFTDRVINVTQFGPLSDFQEVSLLWRQCLNIKIIESTLEDHQQSALTQYILNRLELSTGQQEQKASAGVTAAGIGLRAESMSWIYTKPLPEIDAADDQSSSEFNMSQIDYDDFRQLEQSIRTLDFNQNGVQEEQQVNQSQQFIEEEEEVQCDVLDTDTLPIAGQQFELRRNTVAVFQSNSQESFLDQDGNYIKDLYEAKYSYHSNENGELKFKKGDILRVIKKDDSGWFYSLKLKESGQSVIVVDEGWAPSNFLQLRQ
ncbi:hypothetical protein MP228_003302 [Amoeboaphelidium protococcarum]|nr:hypothetical protein MP228_003302 [Amoeboaphelidium protococcarum]